MAEYEQEPEPALDHMLDFLPGRARPGARLNR